MVVAVVGSGLIGSAAARHAAEAGHQVILIGPFEPPEFVSAEGPFSSHYDEGRITRITDSDPQWAEWARLSIGRYADIADRSGIEFYTPRPLVFMTPTPDESLEIALSCGSNARLVDPLWVSDRYGLQVPRDFGGGIIYEDSPAGFINPRRLVEAQRLLAKGAGARLVEGVVIGVESGAGGHTLTTKDGSKIEASQIIIATGSYGAGLVGAEAEIERRLRTVTLIEMDGDLPVTILNGLHRPLLDQLYWVPPVRYPDGRTYLKIGGDAVPTRLASSGSEIDDWFRSGGSAEEAEVLVGMVAEMLPGLSHGRIEHKPCVVAQTPDGHPHVSRVSEGVVLALGGCGSAAKSSDELGRQAAAAST